MAVSQFKDADVTDFLKRTIEHGMTYKVDDGPTRYIHWRDNDEIVHYTIDGVTKPLAIFGTNQGEIWFINPFADTAKSAENSWYRSTLRSVLAANIGAVIKTLLKTAVEQSKKGKKAAGDADLLAIELLGKETPNIDAKMLNEFETITADLSKFLSINYDRSDPKKPKGTLTCAITSPAQRRAFSSVREKTWKVLNNLLLKVLNVSDLSEFDYTPTVIGFPSFECFIHVLENVYDHANKALALISREEPDRDIMAQHLANLNEYYAIAKLVRPSVTPGAEKRPVATATAPVTPVVPNLAQPAPMMSAPAMVPPPVTQAIPTPTMGVPTMGMPGMAPGMPGAAVAIPTPTMSMMPAAPAPMVPTCQGYQQVYQVPNYAQSVYPQILTPPAVPTMIPTPAMSSAVPTVGTTHMAAGVHASMTQPTDDTFVCRNPFARP